MSRSLEARSDGRLIPGLVLAGMVLFASLLVALHLLRPDYDPARRFLSEYATGRASGLMTSAFVLAGSAVATLALQLARSLSASRPRTLGCLLLAGAGATDLLMAVFRGDLSALPRIRTWTGHVHDGLSAVHALSWLLAAWVVPRALHADTVLRSFAGASARWGLAIAAASAGYLAVRWSCPGLGQRVWVATLVGWCVAHAWALPVGPRVRQVMAKGVEFTG